MNSPKHELAWKIKRTEKSIRLGEKNKKTLEKLIQYKNNNKSRIINKLDNHFTLNNRNRKLTVSLSIYERFLAFERLRMNIGSKIENIYL